MELSTILILMLFVGLSDFYPVIDTDTSQITDQHVCPIFQKYICMRGVHCINLTSGIPISLINVKLSKNVLISLFLTEVDCWIILEYPSLSATEIIFVKKYRVLSLIETVLRTYLGHKHNSFISGHFLSPNIYQLT